MAQDSCVCQPKERKGGSIHNRVVFFFAFDPAVETRRVGMFSQIAQNYLLAWSRIRNNRINISSS